MNCCVTDMRNKEVISSKSGCRLGFVGDVEIDTCSGKLVSIIIYGRSRCMGILGKEEDIRVCWSDIEVIGNDTVLVCIDDTKCSACPPKGKKGIFDNLFRYS